LFSSISLIYLEPLDLEYLYTAALEGGHICQIYDGILEARSFRKVVKEFRPHVIALTGYITQRDVMIEYSRIAKGIDPHIKMIIGGVHAEINYQDFYKDSVDYIVHSGGLGPFEEILQVIQRGTGDVSSIEGICWKSPHEGWMFNPRRFFDPNDLPIPDRSHFNQNKDKYKYLMYSPCAIVKTSYGCPYNCNFCYCKNLNGGKYSVRDLERVVEEIEAIDCQYIHMVDDTFLVSRERVLRFIELLKLKGISKKYIIYSRADFIVQNPDIIKELKNVGVEAVIVSLEAVADSKLEGFDKKVSSDDNKRCVEILNNADIKCIGLFIVDVDAVPGDFKRISSWIWNNKLSLSTVSIFTPLPGTQNFDKYKDELITDNIEYWDFLHLVLRPKNLGIIRFYLEFYKLNLRIFWIGRRLGGYKFLTFKFLFDITIGYIKRLIPRR